MHIRRDYSQPFFSNKRPRRQFGRWAFLFGLLVGGIALVIGTRIDQIESAAIELLGLAPTATPFPGELAQAALSAYTAGDTATALNLFETALAERPDNIDYVYEYGQILIEIGDYPRAIELGDRAIDLNLFDPRGYALKARAQVWSGDAAAAVTTALAGQAVDDRFAPLYGVLARAYASLGNYSAGLDHGEKAVELAPQDAEMYRSYAYALGAAGSPQQATSRLEQAIFLNPAYVPVYFELAAQYLAQDRDDEAIKLYEQVLLIQPNNARAYLRLCDAYRKGGRFDDAEGFCEDAVNADPTYTAAQFRLGMIKYSKREFEAARTAFQACVDVNAELLECYYRLGLTHYYLALDARSRETVAPPAAVTQSFNAATPGENEMLDMALMAVTEELEAAAAEQTPTPTLTPSPTPAGLSFADHCDLAWTILQESLAQAQVTVGADTIVADVRLGLSLVAQDCPKFRGAAPTLDFTATPEITSTPEAAALTDLPEATDQNDTDAGSVPATNEGEG